MKKKVKKVKKVKKSTTVTGLDIIKSVEEGEADTERLRQETLKRNKSKRFLKWKEKDVQKWTAIDFFGWYLYNYKKYFGEEDVSYANVTSGSSVKVELSRISYFLKRYFNGDKELLKRYISFGIKFASQPDSFYDVFGFWNLFNKRLFLFKMFKNYMNGGKIFKRQSIDDDFSSDEAWEKYYKGEEE